MNSVNYFELKDKTITTTNKNNIQQNNLLYNDTLKLENNYISSNNYLTKDKNIEISNNIIIENKEGIITNKNVFYSIRLKSIKNIKNKYQLLKGRLTIY